jgi:hypothetical protein
MNQDQVRDLIGRSINNPATRDRLTKVLGEAIADAWDAGHGCGVVDVINNRACPGNPYRSES